MVEEECGIPPSVRGAPRWHLGVHTVMNGLVGWLVGQPSPHHRTTPHHRTQHTTPHHTTLHHYHKYHYVTTTTDIQPITSSYSHTTTTVTAAVHSILLLLLPTHHCYDSHTNITTNVIITITTLPIPPLPAAALQNTNTLLTLLPFCFVHHCGPQYPPQDSQVLH